jgi:hypothetical protein
VEREVRKFAKSHGDDKKISKEVLLSEAKIARDSAVGWLVSVTSVQPVLPQEWPRLHDHPVAYFFYNSIRPSMEFAAFAKASRDENLQLIRLTLRLLQLKEPPPDLSHFGDDAKSPLNGMAFEYRRSQEGFEILRPRGGKPEVGRKK